MRYFLILILAVCVFPTQTVQAATEPCVNLYKGYIKVSPIYAISVKGRPHKIVPLKKNKWGVYRAELLTVKNCIHPPQITDSPYVEQTLLLTGQLFFNVGDRYQNTLTDYKAAVRGDICSEIPEIYFYAHPHWNVRRNQKDYVLLRRFYIRESTIWHNFGHSIRLILKKSCNSVPDKMRVKLLHYYDDPSRTLYEGYYYFDKPTHFNWEDDDPKVRASFERGERSRQRRIAATKRAGEERLQKIIDTVTALTVGYVQGIGLEFADEGICAVKSLFAHESYEREVFVNCHNYLNDLQDRVKADAPTAFLLANLAGVMKSTIELAEENPNDTDLKKALRDGFQGCSDGVIRLIGSLRIGEQATEQQFGEACVLEGALQAAIGAAPKLSK